MFRSEDMRIATIFSLNSEREKIFSALQKSEIIQLSEIKDGEVFETLKKNPPVDKLKDTSDLLLRVSRLVHICKLVDVKLSFPEKMFGLDILNKEKVKRTDAKTQSNEATQLLNKIEKPLLNLEEQYLTSQEELEERKQLAKTVKTLQNNGISPELLSDTNNISILSGIVSVANLEKLEYDVQQETDGYGFVLTKNHGPKEKVIVAGALKEYSAKLSFILKKHGVSAFVIPELPKVKNITTWLEGKIKASKKSISTSLIEIKKYRLKHFRSLVVAREKIEILKNQVESMHKLLSGNDFFILQGWVPKRMTIELSKLMFETTQGHSMVDFEKPQKTQEDVPVKLTNPKWLKPFEMLTELYALPKYKDLDPTFIVGPIFLIFAGFMLTDFFYGLGFVGLGLFILLYVSKYAPDMRDMGISITGIGFFSMFFGILTGSYLGDAMSYFIGKSSAQLAFWKDPLADPLYFLLISLGVAVIHLNIGLVMGAVEDFRKKDYKTLVKDRLVWWMLQIGIALIYFGVPKIIWEAELAVTLLLIVVTAGPLGILGITGFMGDVISYSRLFALALSTAGIAMTFNLLANMLYGIPYIGIFVAALMFIVGHMFSFAMNGLGAFVHSIRLQFVEFFGKFYEGGGDKFEPFKEERYYTEVEE